MNDPSELVPPSVAGQLAGLGTALCWVGTSFCFAAAGRALGAGTVNLVRSFLALVPLLALNLLILGTPWPDASPTAIAWLAASGLVGLALGDQFLFGALVDLGPRLAVLLMTLAPVFAALLGWWMLGEVLGGLALLGMATTLAGIAWVVSERTPEGSGPVRSKAVRTRGLILGVLAAAAQGFGVVLAKEGMVGGDIEPLAAQLVRMTAGAAVLGLAWIAIGPRSWLVGSRRDDGPPRVGRGAVLGILGGTILGPVVGVWLSLIAVRRLDAGVASTLMAMSPVLVLPFSRLLERERLGWRAILGAAVAVAGVAILALAEGSDATVAAEVGGLDVP